MNYDETDSSAKSNKKEEWKGETQGRRHMVLNISWVTSYLPGWINNNTNLAAKKWACEEGTNVNGDVTDWALSRKPAYEFWEYQKKRTK
jgi:hypothetical protein